MPGPMGGPGGAGRSIEKAKDFKGTTKKLMKNYYIVISSNRPAEQIVEYMNKLNCGIEFKLFNKDMDENMYWNDSDAIGVTSQKAVGWLYVDDRGFRYKNLEDLKKFIKEEL